MVSQSKKQTRGIETRERVLNVTQQLIADHDFHSVTLDQISKHAEVSKSSLLWHFKSKEELLSEAACMLFQDLERALALEKDDTLSLQEKLDFIITNIGQYFEVMPEPKGVLISLIFNSQIPEEIKESIDSYWENHVDTLVDFLSYPKKAFPREAARAILDVIHGSYVHWYLHKDEKFSQRLKNSFRYMQFS